MSKALTAEEKKRLQARLSSPAARRAARLGHTAAQAQALHASMLGWVNEGPAPAGPGGQEPPVHADGFTREDILRLLGCTAGEPTSGRVVDTGLRLLQSRELVRRSESQGVVRYLPLARPFDTDTEQLAGVSDYDRLEELGYFGTKNGAGEWTPEFFRLKDIREALVPWYQIMDEFSPPLDDKPESDFRRKNPEMAEDVWQLLSAVEDVENKDGKKDDTVLRRLLVKPWKALHLPNRQKGYFLKSWFVEFFGLSGIAKPYDR